MPRSALSPTLRVTIIDTIIVTYSDFESGAYRWIQAGVEVRFMKFYEKVYPMSCREAAQREKKWAQA